MREGSRVIMRILLYGASGMVGSRLAGEALRRGHQVTGVDRSGATSASDDPNLTPVVSDADDPGRVAKLAAGHDVVVSALAPPRDGTEPTRPFLAVNRALIEGVRASGVRRLAVVGGAGSLLTGPGPGTRLVDAPGFPESYRPEALAHAEVLDLYRTVADLDWTCLSPAAAFGPGERTGGFRLGGDEMLTDADGKSAVSAQDYAIAFLDELETPRHTGERFSVAY
jgi:uncharacterized protein